MVVMILNAGDDDNNANNDGSTTTIIMAIMIAGNSVEQVVPGPDFTAGVKNVTVPEGMLVVLLY